MRVTVDKVTKRFDKAGVVLSDVSLEIAPGSRVAIVGPSGSGKSTLLSIIALHLVPNSGIVLFDGQTMDTRRARVRARAQIAWVFQSASVLPRRTALENAALGALSRGMTGSDSRLAALSALASIGLAERAGAETRRLSGGEVQRVAIARAVLGRPALLLADEPTGQLDAQTTDTVADFMLGAAYEDMSVVVATHDAEIARRCDSIVELRMGTVRGNE